MRMAIAAFLLVVLLGGAFLLGHRLGTPARPAAGTGGPAMQAPPQSPPMVEPRLTRIGGARDGAGVVRGAPIRVQGDAVRSAHAAPDRPVMEVGRIRPDARAYLGETMPDAARRGIVYKAVGTLGDACGVSAPVSTRQTYAGACRAGWVSRQSVQPVAG